MDQDEVFLFNTAKSIWLRSRTNALAHKLYGHKIGQKLNMIILFQIFFIVLPIVFITLKVQFQNQLSALEPYLDFGIIISNSIILFLGMISYYFKFEDEKCHHIRMHLGYQRIAQKIRRLEKGILSLQESKYLCRELEETFELYKSMGEEPPSKYFLKAQKNLKEFNSLPFNLSQDDVAI